MDTEDANRGWVSGHPPSQAGSKRPRHYTCGHLQSEPPSVFQASRNLCSLCSHMMRSRSGEQNLSPRRTVAPCPAAHAKTNSQLAASKAENRSSRRRDGIGAFLFAGESKGPEPGSGSCVSSIKGGVVEEGAGWLAFGEHRRVGTAISLAMHPERAEGSHRRGER